jgi:hypothetical protein
MHYAELSKAWEEMIAPGSPFEMCGIRACRLMFLFRPGFASRLFTGVPGELYLFSL